MGGRPGHGAPRGEAELGSLGLKGARLDLAVLAVAVEAVDDVAKDARDVYGRVQRADDARIAIGQAVPAPVKKLRDLCDV